MKITRRKLRYLIREAILFESSAKSKAIDKFKKENASNMKLDLIRLFNSSQVDKPGNNVVIKNAAKHVHQKGSVNHPLINKFIARVNSLPPSGLVTLPDWVDDSKPLTISDFDIYYDIKNISTDDSDMLNIGFVPKTKDATLIISVLADFQPEKFTNILKLDNQSLRRVHGTTGQYEVGKPIYQSFVDET